MMQIGMLWFDNERDKTLAEKVADAAAYYRRKYGQAPNYCETHPAPDLPERVGTVRIVPSRQIIPNHLWIGIETDDQ